MTAMSNDGSKSNSNKSNSIINSGTSMQFNKKRTDISQRSNCSKQRYIVATAAAAAAAGVAMAVIKQQKLLWSLVVVGSGWWW